MAGGNLGSLGGLAGLTKSINTTESATRDLGTLNVLSENLKRDRAESLQLQQLEADEYDQISKAAAPLLQRDRDKVNAKAIELSSIIADGVSQYGSRKKFYENGGLAKIKRYKSDLLNSPEVSQYNENKTNMERILQLQVSGKGHLLSPTDLRALQSYQSGEGDKIKYSGLMSELEYPAEFHAFGSVIPDQAVLDYKDNYSRIYGNYLTENGTNSLAGLTPQQTETELLSFMKRMNYTGIGQDQFPREQAAAMQRQMYQNAQKTATVKSGTEKEEKESWLSSVNNFLNDIVYDKKVSSKELLDGHYITKKASEEDIDYLGVANTPWTQSFKKTATKSQSLLNAFGNIMPGQFFKPASAVAVPINDNKKVAALTGFGVNEDGTVNYTLDTSLYNADGNKFSADDVDDFMFAAGGMDLEGKAKVVGSFIGFKTADDQILMNVVDSKGKVKKDQDNENRNAYKESEPKHSMFVALKSADNQVFYKEVDITSTLGQTGVSNILAEDDDTTNTVNTRKRTNAVSTQSKAIVGNNRKLVLDNFQKASSAKGAFGNEEFVNEALAFKSPNNKSNRTNLIKAYYMAYDSFANKNSAFDANRLNKAGLTNQNAFTNSLSVGNLGNDIIDYNVGDSTFIKNYADSYNDDEELSADQKQNNLAFADLWSKYYKTILSNTQ